MKKLYDCLFCGLVRLDYMQLLSLEFLSCDYRPVCAPASLCCQMDGTVGDPSSHRVKGSIYMSMGYVSFTTTLTAQRTCVLDISTISLTYLLDTFLCYKFIQVANFSPPARVSELDPSC
jgi:hypothetical protein